jgi:CreA protein
MKKIFVLVLIMLLVPTFALAVDGRKVASQVCVERMVQGDDTINIIAIEDPENPFITIYFTNIDSGQWLAAADPSNTAIAARLTGEIPKDQNGNMIINKKPNSNIGSIRQSIGSKEMKVGRYYDANKNVLVYLVYTTKWMDGSLKHSLSVVPLGNPLTPQ